MGENKDTEQVERSGDRRESTDRRKGEQVTAKKLFNDYGFEEERKDDGSRRDGKSRRDS